MPVATPPAVVIPGSPAYPASAACPACGNTVYNDGLRLLNPVVEASGRTRYLHLLICCETCGGVNTIAFSN
jgi:hypothetical protein